MCLTCGPVVHACDKGQPGRPGQRFNSRLQRRKVPADQDEAEPCVGSWCWWTDCHREIRGMLAPDQAWWREPDTGHINSCQTGRNGWEASEMWALRRNRLHSCGCFDLEITLFWRVIWGKPKEILAQKLGFVLNLGAGGGAGSIKSYHSFSLIFFPFETLTFFYLHLVLWIYLLVHRKLQR